MSREIPRSVGIITVLLVTAVGLQGQFSLYVVKAKDLQLVYYSKQHEYIVPHLTRAFTNSFGFHRNLFNYKPGEDVTLLLQDFNDYGYGGADALPTDHVNIGISPFSYEYELSPANERMNWLMNHELTHLVTTDMSSRTDRIFRTVFGGKVTPSIENPVSIFYSYLTNPRRYAPRWYHEGIAVFMETWMAGGYGRVLGGYDEMVFRTKVLDNAYIYDMVGLESEGKTSDFQVGHNSYLYGTRFMAYLAYTHGVEKLLKWVSRTDGSHAYFVSAFKQVYGQDIDDEWSGWIEWEKGWQRANLDSIRLYPTTSYRPISDRPLGSISRGFFDPRTRILYLAVRYPGEVAHFAAINIDSGEMEKIHNIKGPALFYVCHVAFDAESHILFYTTDNNHLRDLRSFNLATGDTRMLIKDLRAGDLAFNPADRSVWGVRHADGFSTIVRVLPPYDDWETIHTLDYAHDIYDLDISPDGRVMTAALVSVSGHQTLVKMDMDSLAERKFQPELLYDFDVSSPANFTFSADGRFLFGSSYYTGVSNIFRYDFEQDTMVVISNCESGFFRPVPVSKDSLIVMAFTGQGFLPVMIANEPVEDVSAVNYLGMAIVDKWPKVLSWETKAPPFNFEELTTYVGSYSPVRSMRLSSVYPIVEGYKDSPAYGIHFDFLSKLGLSRLDGSATFSPPRKLTDDEKIHLRLNFQLLDWKLSAGYNAADFYDLFGPTKRSRKGYYLRFQTKKRLIEDWPLDYSASVAGYGGLERMPEYQNVDVTFNKFYNVNISLRHSTVLRTIGSVDNEMGQEWTLVSIGNYVNSKLYPLVYTNFNYGFLLPRDHLPLWLRTSFGYSFAGQGDRENSFANFYFGGFGNNWIDYLGVKRYRAFYSFPGVELNSIGGTSFAKVMSECVLPPLRFRRVGSPLLYLNWSRFSFFTSTITTNIDDRNARTLFYNLGAQIDTRLVLFAHLTSTFSLGYAIALERDKQTSTWKQPYSPEFMVSLQILK